MRRLALTTGLTSLGKWGFAVTLGVYAFQQGGAKAVGLVALAQALPAMLLAPFLALVGERRPRRDVLLVANFLRGAILVAAAVAMVSDLPLAVFALAVAYSVVSTTNQPARAALLTALARSPRDLSAGNALLGSADTIGFLAGSGLGGLRSR
jgi:predicted MFS family arabinose efflux permease